MIRRSTRLTAIAGVSVVALAGVGLSTGGGGGSPWQVPHALDTGITHPSGGNALYVFKLRR